VIYDSQRADHCSCYGYERETTPVMDSLAAAGTMFANAQSAAPWTLPAVTTVLTGLHPQRHGAGEVESNLYGLDPGLPFLPALMQEAGYHTFGEFCIPWLGPEFGFDRGWDEMLVYTGRALDGHLPESAVHLGEWLTGIPQEERFFAVVHVFEMHNPFDPSPPYDTMFAVDSLAGYAGTASFTLDGNGQPFDDLEALYLETQYDGEIRMADAGIGVLLDTLEASGRLAETVVVLVADHGEEFMERGGYDHGHTLFQEMLHVPLVFCGPGVPAGRIVTRTVGQADITPTILALAGAPAPALADGIDILAGDIPERAIPSGSTRSNTLYCVRMGDRKVVLDSGAGRLMLFDLAADPAETLPLPPDSALADSIVKYLALPRAGNRSVVLDDDAARTLRGLGYI
jgi:arylsulfatase A-like enzyme